MPDARAQFFLSSPRSVAQLELLEISHPSFSKTYRIVRNNPYGVVAKHEDGVQYAYEYYPLRVTRKGATDDLDSGLQIDLGDLGDIVSAELDRVRLGATFTTRPVVKFRVYGSDNLNTLIYGPLIYEAVAFGLSRDGTSFLAQAPTLNSVKTGARYTPDRFICLRGML